MTFFWSLFCFIFSIPFLPQFLKASSIHAEFCNQLVEQCHYFDSKLTLPAVVNLSMAVANTTFIAKRLLHIDDPFQQMSIHGLFYSTWRLPDCARWDHALTINKQHAMANVKSCDFDKDFLWRPDFVVRNSVAGDYVMERFGSKIKVLANGMATWVAGGPFQVACHFHYQYFPFDVNSCCIEFHCQDDFEQVFIENMTIKVLPTFMTNSDIFQLEQYHVEIIRPTAPFRTTDMSACFRFSRKHKYYVVSVFLPLASVMLIQLSTILVDPANDRQSFAVTVMLSLAVYQQIFSALIPKTAEVVYLFYYILVNVAVAGLVTIYVVIMSSLRRLKLFKRRIAIYRMDSRISIVRITDLVAFSIALFSLLIANIVYFSLVGVI